MSTDVPRYLDKPAAIVGTTGAGETYAAKGAVEHLLELQRRVIIIDPMGAWWGLRAGSALHPHDGFPVIIFGGEHADVAISPDAEAGKALALALAERHVQATIDISEMTGARRTGSSPRSSSISTPATRPRCTWWSTRPTKSPHSALPTASNACSGPSTRSCGAGASRGSGL